MARVTALLKSLGPFSLHRTLDSALLGDEMIKSRSGILAARVSFHTEFEGILLHSEVKAVETVGAVRT